MSEIRVSYRYAKSLFDLATEKNILERAKEDAESFLQISESNKAFENMMRSPIVHADKKWAVINKIFAGSFNEMTISFIKIVIRKKREFLTADIFKAFIDLYNTE